MMELMKTNTNTLHSPTTKKKKMMINKTTSVKQQQQQQQPGNHNLQRRRNNNSKNHHDPKKNHNNNKKKKNIDNPGTIVLATTTTTTPTNTTTTTATTTTTMMMTTDDICDMIAELCESILEDPQAAFQRNTSNSNDNNDHFDIKGKKKKQKTTTTTKTSNTSSSSSSLSKMDQLLYFARFAITTTNIHDHMTNYNSTNNIDIYYISQLAIMSLVIIYKDIIPSYRIRIPTQDEMMSTNHGNISKDVLTVWNYEKHSLSSYQQYITIIQQIYHQQFSLVVSTKSSEQQIQIQSQQKIIDLSNTAMVSLCELFKSTFHFNFRNDIISFLIQQCMSTNKNKVVHNHHTTMTCCCQTMEYIYQHDVQGDVTIEMIRQITKLFKEKIQQQHTSLLPLSYPMILQTFLTLPLRVHDDEKMAAQMISHMNSKKRKRQKELSIIESEMKESSMTVDKVTLAKHQSDILQCILLTYFRIIKCCCNTTTTNNTNTKNKTNLYTLLPSTLMGLAKFAHLINIDTVIDVLHVLRNLLQSQQQQQLQQLYHTSINHEQQPNVSSSSMQLLPIDVTLNCIYTAFLTLQGPGKEMQIDIKEYIVPLYNQIPRMMEQQNSNHTSDSHTVLLLQCLSYAFIKRREYSNVRIAAFMKQLLSITLQTPSYISIPLLAFVRQLLQRYSNALEQLLENEADVITEGQYNFYVDDPEHCNPYATSAWEVATLKFHYHPNVVVQAMGVGCNKILNLPLEVPEKLHTTEFHHTVHELHIPFHRNMKRHPLHQSVSSSSDNISKKQKIRHQIRFIKPRIQTCSIK